SSLISLCVLLGVLGVLVVEHQRAFIQGVSSMQRMHWLVLAGAAIVGTVSMGAAAVAPSGFADVPEGYWAQRAITTVAARGVMPPKAPGAFKPDQTVTRAELASILVRLIDTIENQGPQKLSGSPSKPHVPRAQRTGLARLPRNHPAYPAM